MKSWVLSGNLTTAYIGNHFEYTSSTNKRTYYYAGGQRVAVRFGAGYATYLDKSPFGA